VTQASSKKKPAEYPGQKREEIDKKSWKTQVDLFLLHGKLTHTNYYATTRYTVSKKFEFERKRTKLTLCVCLLASLNKLDPASYQQHMSNECVHTLQTTQL